MAWKDCYKCGYFFDNEDPKNKEHGIIMVKGEITGYICPVCTGKVS